MVKPETAWIGENTLQRLDHDPRWRALSEAVARDWPDRPEPLDDTDVLRRLEFLAGQVARRWPAICRQVIDDAPGVILLAFAGFQAGRRFYPWARQVLHNHAVSLYRRQRRMQPHSDFLQTLPAAFTSRLEDDLAEALHDFRRLCDRVRFPARTADGPELAAVFALETRLRLLAHLVRRGPDFIDCHLPLRSGERLLRVQRDWPTLGELWACLASTAEPGQDNIDAIRGACRRLAATAPVASLHKVWGTWLYRAKGAVARHLQSSIQDRLFFYLFPKHRPSMAQSRQAS
jgi:hypothetical protein